MQSNPTDSGSEVAASAAAHPVGPHLDELADQYLTELQAGRKPDRAAWVAAHPDQAPELEARLELVERLFRGMAQPGAPSAGPTSQLTPGDVGSAARSVDGVAPTIAAAAAATPSGQARTALLFEASTIAAEAAIHVFCPHCGNDIQVVQPAAHEVTCQNCGSTVEVDSSPTISYHTEQHPARVGRFEIIEVLGRGGFGNVYKAHDSELNRTVALKVPRAGYFATPEDQARFLREARNAAQLRHPNIVQVYDVAQDRGVPYIISDFIEGLTLADLLTGGQLAFRDSADLLARVAEALDYAHQNRVVHRDIKPNNILIDVRGQPHIADFGLARRDEGEITVTMTGQVLGTPAFMAPEQAAGENDRVGTWSDVYSLGVTLYRMLTGELPFRGSRRMLLHQVRHEEPRPPRRVNEHIPRDLETICLKAMSKDIHRRYQTAREFAAELRRWLAGEPIHARPVTRAERVWRWCRRNPTVAGLLATVIVLLATIATASLVVARRENRLRDVADRALERNHLAQGAHLWERGNAAGALLSYVEAIRLNPDDPRRGLMHRLRAASILRQHPKLEQVWVHGAAISAAQFSPDGRRVVIAGHDGTVSIVDLPTARTVVAKHNDSVLHASFSPDSRRLATAGRDNVVRVWDVETATPVPAAPMTHDNWVKFVAFSPDGKRLVSASDDGTARMWDLGTGALTARLVHSALPGPDGRFFAPRVIQAIFSTDGKQILTVNSPVHGLPAEVRRWDGATGQAIGEPLRHSNYVYRVEFTPDGRRFLTGCEDGTTRVWDTQTVQSIASFFQAPGWMTATFSPDGRYLATAGDRTAHVLEIETARPVMPALLHDAAVTHVAFSFDSRHLVTTTADGAARVWDVLSGEPQTPALHHTGRIDHAAFSPDGRRLLTACVEGAAKLWDLAAVVSPAPALEHRAHILRASFSRDGQWALTCSADGTAVVWDVARSQPIAAVRHDAAVIDAVFSRDGQRFATADTAGIARLWQSATGRPATPWLEHGKALRAVSVSPDGQLLVTAGEDGSARIWNTSTSGAAARLVHRGPINWATFSPDGRLVATASDDGTARLWEPKAGTAHGDPLSHNGKVRRVFFSPDGRYLLSTSADKTAAVWQVDSLRRVAVFSHRATVATAAFSPDGKRVATASWDDTAMVWDAATARPTLLARLTHHHRDIDHVAFSPDGQLLLTMAGGPEGEARVWDSVTGDPITPTLSHPGPVVSGEFSPSGSKLMTAGDTTAQIWDITPDAHRFEDLAALAQVLSAQQVLSDGRVVNMPLSELQASWRSLGERQPGDFVGSPAAVFAWHLRGAEECARSGRWHAAATQSTLALGVQAKDSRALRQRARAHAELGRWTEAAGDLANVAPPPGQEALVGYERALVRLAASDSAAFGSECSYLLRRFGETDDRESAGLVAWVCALTPKAGVDAAQVVRLAERAMGGPRKQADRLRTLGAALYRAQQYESAIRQLQQSLELESAGTVPPHEARRAAVRRGSIELLLAMARLRAGKDDDARKTFGQAIDRVSALQDGDATAHPPTWHQRLEWQLLRDEAETLVRPPKPRSQ